MSVAGSGFRGASGRTRRRSIAGYLAALTALTIVLGPLMPSPAMATAWTRSSLTGSPSLVRVIDTSILSPPIPDPSGIEYLPASGSLLVADAEVEEAPLAGVNVFRATTGGVLLATSSTTAFSNEPTGTRRQRGERARLLRR
jgi:hypothetical protein